MSAEVLTIGGFALLVVIVLTGFPTGFGIMIAGIVLGYLGMGSSFFYMIPERIVNGTLSEYIFAAVPLFVLMGTLMGRTGVMEQCYDTMHKWLGGLRGGLAVATILICTLFAATTGVIGASVVTMGILAIPAMLRRGYSKELASGCVCAGGSLGQLIPPSVMLIMYAPMAGVSVVEMFEAAFLPGFLLSALFCIYIIVLCLIKPKMGPAAPPEDRLKFISKESLHQGLTRFAPPIFIILAVLGSIVAGLASPTEAGALGVVAVLVLMLVRRQFKWELVKSACQGTIVACAMVFFIAAAASTFTGAFLGSGCGFVVSDFLLGMGLGKWGIFVVTLVIITVLGMFIDWIGVLYILVPILGPLLMELGFDPLWMGMVICIALQMSFLTPPFAYSIFYLRGLDLDLDIPTLYKGVVPFLGLQLLGTALCIIFPKIIMVVPDAMRSGW
ncbi:MAG: TRAP transporter large permease subunit [Dehalococcoidia bacterium]|nr:TRAP transporter large permease subunit [Dehalococcoidia bacterium]